MSSRHLGIFLHPLDVQSEGLESVFDNLQRVRATAIALKPKLACPAEDGNGVRFPDLHVDGYERVLGRPIWGRHELQLRFYPARDPNLALYDRTPYRPQQIEVPPELDRDLPDKMIERAHALGMDVHLEVQPFLPADLRRQDEPVFIDGSQPNGTRVAHQACLNRPDVRAFASALIEDHLRQYPSCDGLFIDWAEFPAYQLEDHFACFCSGCEAAAGEAGFDWNQIRHDVTALWDWAHRLDTKRLELARFATHNPSVLLELLAAYPGWLEFFRFKADTVTAFYREVRELMDRLGMRQVKLSARGWPPPWNRSSGMDYRALARVCDAITPKLFTFDYSVLPRWYGQTLLVWNPDLTETETLDALVDLMALPDDKERRTFADYHIPAPGETHPARIEAYRQRIDEVRSQIGNKASLYPYAHAYLPEPQWKRMLAMLRDAPVDGIWVQMYGYLSEPKLRVLQQVWT